jgi:hypothetical protein
MEHSHFRAGLYTAPLLLLSVAVLAAPGIAQRCPQPAKPTGPRMDTSVSPDQRADLLPDPLTGTLMVPIDKLTSAAHDLALEHLSNELNAAEATFPGTDLRMISRIGSG